jgi:hypothetical protein
LTAEQSTTILRSCPSRTAEISVVSGVHACWIRPAVMLSRCKMLAEESPIVGEADGDRARVVVEEVKAENEEGVAVEAETEGVEVED